MANQIDVHVGQRLRQRRWMLGLTQQQLGDRIGIKLQQVQKYETGQNRISASRLWELARATEVEITYFFDGLDCVDEIDAPETDAPEAEPAGATGDLLKDRETIDLVRCYYAAPAHVRRRFFDLLRIVSEEVASEIKQDGVVTLNVTAPLTAGR